MKSYTNYAYFLQQSSPMPSYALTHMWGSTLITEAEVSQVNEPAVEPIWRVLEKAGYEEEALRIKREFEIENRARALSKQLKRKAQKKEEFQKRI